MAFDSKNRCMQKICLLALFVKMCLEWPAGHDKHEIKNKFSAEYGQSARGSHSKSFYGLRISEHLFPSGVAHAAVCRQAVAPLEPLHGGSGGRSHLRKRAARHRELAHASSFPSTPCKAPSPLWSYGTAALVFGCLPSLFSGSRGLPRSRGTSPRPGLAWGLGPSIRRVRLPDDTMRKAGGESCRRHG